MTGTITTIQHLTNKTTKEPYIAVRFKCDDDIQRVTYLSRDNRNWPMWKPHLQKGKVLEGLVLKEGSSYVLDADCQPSVYNDNQIEMELT